MSLKKYGDIYAINSLFLLPVLVIFLGLFFRFINLDSKVFWVDEVATAVRVSGYTISEVSHDLLQQNIVNFDTLISYQRLGNSRTFLDSISALIKSPEHTPLYFLLTRIWMQLWGSSILAMRSLSAWLSLLIFPSLYWLCQELFNRILVSWVSIVLISISPFYVTYAQEARPYSLWTVAILVMSASFLAALRINRKKTWLIYSFSLVFGFYTSLFSLYVAGFQGIYLLFSFQEQKIELIKKYFLALLFALILFTPWIWVIVDNIRLLQENTSWMRGNFSIPDIIAVLIGTNLLIFGDLPLSTASNPIQIAIALIAITVTTLIGIKIFTYRAHNLGIFLFLAFILGSILSLSQNIYLDWTTIIGALVALVILSLSIYSLYYVITQTKSDRWLFIVTLMLSLPLPLLITDIINQGQSSTAPRYLIPFQLGILIAVAYTFGSKLAPSGLNSIRQQRLWQIVLAFWLTLGIFSCVRNLNLSPFYQKGRNVNNIAIAEIINQSDFSLVITEDREAMDLLSLAYSLTSEAKYKIINSTDDVSQNVANFAHVYILKPSSKLINKLSDNQKFKLTQVFKSHVFSADEFPLDLWQIEFASDTLGKLNKSQKRNRW